MARLLTRAASEYLVYSNAAAISAVPFTFACWFNSSDATVNQELIVVTDPGSNVDYFGMAADGTTVGDLVRGYTYDGVGWGEAITTSGYTVGTWHHAAYVSAAINDRAILIDGRSKGTNAVASTPGGLGRTVIGAWDGLAGPSGYFDGSIAEAVILRIAATDYQIWLHAQGMPAPLIWPGWAIAAYWPLLETDRDFPVGNYNMSPQNAPDWAPHPPKVLEYWRRYRQGR